MSDEKDTAESPELTAEEQTQLAELEAKKKAVEEAEAVAAAEEAAEEKAEEQERIANRPLFHVLVRHMGRSARTRTLRHARSGHRRQGVVLDDGSRIRKRGKYRYTELNLMNFVENHQRLLEFVRVGTIEVCDPKTEYAIPYEDLVDLLERVAGDEFEVDESGVQEEEVLPGSSPENSSPGLNEEGETDLSSVEMPPPPPPPDLKEGEEDSDEGESEGSEKNEEGGEEGYTAEDLMKMTRPDLNKMASDNGIESPEALGNKQEVVDAIFKKLQPSEEG